MLNRENIGILQEYDYGVEELLNGHIDVYNNKFEFVDRIKNDEQLQALVDEVVKKNG